MGYGLWVTGYGLFEAKNEIDGTDEQDAGYDMIPAYLHVKRQCREDNEDHEGDDLLDDLQLHKRERSAVAFETDAVRRHLQTVLKKSDSPREQDHEDKRCGIGEETGLLHLQVTVPRQRHKDIRR